MAVDPCPTCRLRFLSLTGFDAHRSHGSCLDPSALGMVQRDGVWRLPMTQAARERINDIKSVRGGGSDG